MSAVVIIQAGGTIDKDYLAGDGHHGYNFLIDKPAVIAIAQRANIPYPLSYCYACQKDSLDMTDDDRNAIKGVVAGVIYNKIIITHGTDTILLTALHLADLELGNKVVVLTGAMKPERFHNSDADFNLGMAMGTVHSAPPGIYIALYGEVTRWDEFVPR